MLFFALKWFWLNGINDMNIIGNKLTSTNITLSK
jgi:hypothetical protein